MIKDHMLMQHIVLHTTPVESGAIISIVSKLGIVETVIGYCFASGHMYDI